MTKRVWIIATVATMMGIAANAQTQIGVGPSVYGYHIPAEFTIDGQSKIAVMGENGVVSIYNRDLQQTHQLTGCQLHQLDMTSIGHFGNGGDYGRVAITQTFFNNDAHYEYIIINGYEQDMWRGATIMSEDGTVIWSWQPSGNNWGGDISCGMGWPIFYCHRREYWRG